MADTNEPSLPLRRHLIANAGNTFQTDVVFFGVLLFTVTGLVTVALLDRLERRFDAWRPAVGGAR